MTAAELARQLLIDAPSDITKALFGHSTAFHQDATCPSCHRVVAAIVYRHTLSGRPGWMAAHR